MVESRNLQDILNTTREVVLVNQEGFEGSVDMEQELLSLQEQEFEFQGDAEIVKFDEEIEFDGHIVQAVKPSQYSFLTEMILGVKCIFNNGNPYNLVMSVNKKY